MNSDEREQLKQKLQADLLEIRSSIDTLEEATKPIAPDDAIGRLTRMDAINTKSINEEHLRNAKVKRGQLERAIKQVDDPDFGFCLECEESIPFKRLQLMPESRLCVKCKAQASR
ncbi:MAG: TraR/DksA C4-type zinc finger protein [SAR324 cluster bacterium]|nr:TraR/DksA C4-type zinc finger protein [SAR324 cluster bacterium]